MKRLKRIGIGFLALAVFNLQVPLMVFAAQGSSIVKVEGISKNPPEMLATPEVNMPGEMVEAKKSKTWLWYVLGAVVVGAAAASGGGGGGGGGNRDGSGGSVAVGW
jgi:predicted phage tail protein